MNLRSALALLLLVGLGVAGFWIIGSMPAQMAGLLGGTLGFLASSLVQSARENKARLYEKKREVYTKLLEPFFTMQSAAIAAPKQPTAAADEAKKAFGPEFLHAKFDAMLYASDDVIQAFLALEASALALEDGQVALALYARLLKAMRKDLGHTFTTLAETDLLSMLVRLTPEDRQQFQSTLAATRKTGDREPLKLPLGN